MITINNPLENTYLGCVKTTFPNLSMAFSKTLFVAIAFVFAFQDFKLIIAGNNVELNIQANIIPALMVMPYPIRGSKGDVVMTENAATVVMLVRKIGMSNESIVEATAFRLFFNILNSLKNLVITCTPSEFAMVSKMIGMDVLAKVNRNLPEPVNLNIHPMKPIIAPKESIITVITMATAAQFRKFNNRIMIMMNIPVAMSPFTSSRINGGNIPVK